MKSIRIGRNISNDIVLNNKLVSSFHATIQEKESSGTRRFLIVDNNSTNGTFVNGKMIKEVYISESDVVKVSDVKLNWISYFKQDSIPQNIQKTVTVGRNNQCDVVISQGNVSSFHAKLVFTIDGKAFIVDTNSSNGTCVNNKKVTQKQLFPGDVVTLSGQHMLSWEQYASKQSKKTDIIDEPSINFHEDIVIPVKKKSKLPLILGAAVVIIVLLGAGYYIHKSGMFVDYNLRYKNSVVMIYHSYVFEVAVGDTKMYFTRTTEGIQQYDPQKNSPINITGTGFIVSEDGKIITNRHIATPWNYDKGEQKQLSDGFMEFLTSNINTKADLQYAIRNASNVHVGGHTLYMGIAYNDSFVNSVSDFHECLLIRESGNDEVDVACIQLKNKTIPEKVEYFIDLDEAITDKDMLYPGKEVSLIGYPMNWTIGDTHEGLKANFQSGTITREPDGINLGHNLATIGGGSGSPIFDCRGRLVAVNNAGVQNTQGFNFAILAKHAQKLLE